MIQYRCRSRVGWIEFLCSEITHVACDHVLLLLASFILFWLHLQRCNYFPLRYVLCTQMFIYKKNVFSFLSFLKIGTGKGYSSASSFRPKFKLFVGIVFCYLRESLEKYRNLRKSQVFNSPYCRVSKTL